MTMTVGRLQLAFNLILAGVGIIAVSGLLHGLYRLGTDPPDVASLLADAAAIISGWGLFDWLVLVGFVLMLIGMAIVVADILQEEFGRDANAE